MKERGMQTASQVSGSGAEAFNLFLLIACIALFAGGASWQSGSNRFGFPSAAEWGQVRTQALRVARFFADKGKEDEKNPLDAEIPSIAPLADKIPLGKVDGNAINRNILRSNADKLVVIDYFSKKYNVDPLTMSAYIQHAIEAGSETRIEPLLLLAIMSIESNFNPLVESPAGAQGLMQVLTRIHAKKFEPYGGVEAAFRPEVNIRVGALIIKQAIALMGSLQGGLFFYVGAAKPDISDGGFADKVLTEYNRLLSLIGRGGQGIAPAGKPVGIGQLLERRPDETIDGDSSL